MAKTHRTRRESNQPADQAHESPVARGSTPRHAAAMPAPTLWDMNQEREWWARRRGNDWPVSARAAAVLDEHAARRRKGTLGDRACAVAATLKLQDVPWYAREPKAGAAREPKTGIEYWTGVSPQTLEARREWPELVE